jgi:DNA-binding NtrC family response regulator
MQALRAEIESLGRATLRSVLVLGETGVGKDLVARSLLACSSRLCGSLEILNCPAIPADHLESELFGTSRGAYPGAINRPGAAERARGGILMLDEIGAMSTEHQGKLLRLLETGEGRRLGSERPYRVNACFVAATNEDLRAAMAAGRFREDLFYRLVQDAVLRVPPLRERAEDVEGLTGRFLAELPGTPALAPGALTVLEHYAWPGNVRELRAVVRSAAHLSGGNAVGSADVEAAIARIGGLGSLARPVTVSCSKGAASPPRGMSSWKAGCGSFHELTIALQRQLLIDALAEAEGNRTRAGLLLGFHQKRADRPGSTGGDLPDLAARKRAYRKFEYWWGRLV